jgi:hypothetical protein
MPQAPQNNVPIGIASPQAGQGTASVGVVLGAPQYTQKRLSSGKGLPQCAQVKLGFVGSSPVVLASNGVASSGQTSLSSSYSLAHCGQCFIAPSPLENKVYAASTQKTNDEPGESREPSS